MSRRYHISPEGPRKLTDAEVNAHKDASRLFHNYHKATKPLYKRPLYKDPKTFLALLVIVLVVILVSEATHKAKKDGKTPEQEQEEVAP